uniref:DUF2232 domain-containing protein n=1 Tax=Candidatus Electrothrix sp. TaxID=2170559 RepID=UPI0040575FEA
MGRYGNTSQQNGSFLTARPLLVAFLFFLPIAFPGLIGWLHGLLAVPIFLLLQTAADDQEAGLEVRNGLLIVSLGALLLGRLPMFFFTLTMLPLGYTLHLGTIRQREPAQTGASGIIALTIAWLVFWTVYGIISGSNPYVSLLTDMDAFMGQIITVYRTNGELPPEALYALEQLITGVRELLPKILPGLLAGTVLLTVVLNMVVGRVILCKLAPEKILWPPYSEWRLPDKTIWFLIIAFTLLLLSKGGGSIGVSLAFTAGLLYFFQGAAVLIHTLNRWNLPRVFRLFIYVMLVLQRFGLLLVMIVGIIDTWADIRELDHEDKTE